MTDRPNAVPGKKKKELAFRRFDLLLASRSEDTEPRTLKN